MLTEASEGAVAYVHHFVLYDIRARGFVRPYCLAYVCRNHTRLMELYESLFQCFSLVSSVFHFGNAMNFLNDLVSRSEYLLYLSAVLKDDSSTIYTDDKLLTPSQKEALCESDIDASITQLVELHQQFLLYLDRPMFSEHRELFENEYKQTCLRIIDNHLKDKHMLEEDSISGSPRDISSGNMKVLDFGFSSHAHDIPVDVITSLLGKERILRLM